ncbi:MAG: gliding motility-associated protein GldC [Flavobacteriales bacterium]|jgi:gliding motility-associated protein GldC
MSKEDSQITIKVSTDDNNVPEHITWHASDRDKEPSEARAVFLSVWDPNERNTLRIDLWDKEMNVDDMKTFVFQTMLTMADSLERATGDEELTEALRKFSQAFGKRIGL